jgi:hypothetical protein
MPALPTLFAVALRRKLRMNRSVGLILILVLPGCLSLPGCGSKTTSASAPEQPVPSKADYAKLKTGMSRAEVEAILGKGTDISNTPYAAQWVEARHKDGAKSVVLLRWGGERYNVQVGLDDDKVVYIHGSYPPGQ